MDGSQSIGTGLAADGGGGFRCDAGRDSETAPLAGTFITDIDSGFGKEWDGSVPEQMEEATSDMKQAQIH